MQSGDEELLRLPPSPPRVQPIHPGSYAHVDWSVDLAALSELAIAAWVRPLRSTDATRATRVGLITHCDESAACAFALLAHHAPAGSADRTAALEWRVHDRSLRLEVRYLLQRNYARCNTVQRVATAQCVATRCGMLQHAVTLGQWHHLTVTWAAASGELTITVDAAAGRKVIAGAGAPTTDAAQSRRAAAPPLRIGAIGDADGTAVGFADIEIGSAVAVLARIPSADAVSAAFATRGAGGCRTLSGAAEADGAAVLLACYELREAGGGVVRDASGHGNGRNGVSYPMVPATTALRYPQGGTGTS